MKLKDLTIPEWNGNATTIYEDDNSKVLLLHLENINGLVESGRRNLISVDLNSNIKWIADAPVLGREFGWYLRFSYENNRLLGWYGGSVLVEVDPSNGKILKESFVK